MQLIDVAVPKRVEAVVVLLHGGGSQVTQNPVSARQPSVLRMVPIAHRLARAGRGRLAVVRLLNSWRGWDTTRTPVDDAHHAIDDVTARWGPVPVGLVGHSLGGRAALLAGSHPGVRSVVALNPWVYATDDADLSGRRVLFVHGTDDRIAPAARSRAVADRIARRADVEFVDVPGGKHAMLGHRNDFERPAVRFVVDSLLARRL